jgi:hypothetical protein
MGMYFNFFLGIFFIHDTGFAVLNCCLKLNFACCKCHYYICRYRNFY